MNQDASSRKLSRKKFVSLLAAAPLGLHMQYGATDPKATVGSFPAKDAFSIKGTYMNAAYTHPMSKGSFNEISKFLNQRMMNRQEPEGYDGFERASVSAGFAKLINAAPDEIAWVPSTMVGENLLLAALSLPGSKERVVTDAFHFHGSLFMYSQLAKQGLNLVVVKQHDNKIDLNDLDKAIKPGTRLVAISLVAAATGFQHDLKKVCELAHARGALVYADIIQAAGAVPIDVKESNVDFCACATYKWLMGDFGIGFLYVRKDLLPTLKRSLIGFRQIKTFTEHITPFDPPGEMESVSLENMTGHFEVGTFANEGIAALRYSLQYLNSVGVPAIQQYRQPMIDKLLRTLPDEKFIPLTPPGSVSSIVSFAYRNALAVLKPKLDVADINISVYENMIRISPSFYNDMNDTDKLIEILKSA